MNNSLPDIKAEFADWLSRVPPGGQEWHAAVREWIDSVARTAASEERQACYDLAEEEVSRYLENAKRCDKTGNTHGGTVDTACALACRRVADRIEERRMAAMKDNHKTENPSG